MGATTDLTQKRQDANGASEPGKGKGDQRSVSGTAAGNQRLPRRPSAAPRLCVPVPSAFFTASRRSTRRSRPRAGRGRGRCPDGRADGGSKPSDDGSRTSIRCTASSPGNGGCAPAGRRSRRSRSGPAGPSGPRGRRGPSSTGRIGSRGGSRSRVDSTAGSSCRIAAQPEDIASGDGNDPDTSFPRCQEVRSGAAAVSMAVFTSGAGTAHAASS